MREETKVLVSVSPRSVSSRLETSWGSKDSSCGQELNWGWSGKQGRTQTHGARV